VEIVGEYREAFLYDLTTENPSEGHWLAAEVFDVRFVMEEGEGENAPPVLGQIELAFAGPNERAVLDINGERKVVISGPERLAILSSLEDDATESVVIGRNVVEITMIHEDGTLTLIEVVSQIGDEVTREIFDRNGMPPSSR
jgi:hypothetical protein